MEGHTDKIYENNRNKINLGNIPEDKRLDILENLLNIVSHIKMEGRCDPIRSSKPDNRPTPDLGGSIQNQLVESINTR